MRRGEKVSGATLLAPENSRALFQHAVQAGYVVGE
jgi:hypothetical protein